MEEILASIRRIISEDEPVTEDEPAAVAPAPAAPLPPAPAAPEPAPVVAAPPPVIEEEDEPLVLEDEVLELTDRIEEPHPAAPAGDDLDFAPVTAAPRAPEPAPPMAPLKREEPLVSQPTASTAASAFDALERSVMMPVPGRSLEEVIREMLRPMLKTWLDENLPSIVEAQVAAEVERIARQRR